MITVSNFKMKQKNDLIFLNLFTRMWSSEVALLVFDARFKKFLDLDIVISNLVLFTLHLRFNCFGTMHLLFIVSKMLCLRQDWEKTQITMIVGRNWISIQTIRIVPHPQDFYFFRFFFRQILVAPASYFVGNIIYLQPNRLGKEKLILRSEYARRR